MVVLNKLEIFAISQASQYVSALLGQSSVSMIKKKSVYEVSKCYWSKNFNCPKQKDFLDFMSWTDVHYTYDHIYIPP